MDFNFKNRKEKISFLRGILNGKRNLFELSEPRNTLFIGYKNNSSIFKHSKTHEIYSEQQVEKLKSKYPNKITLVVISEGLNSESEKAILNI